MYDYFDMIAIDTETSGLGENDFEIEVVELYAVEFNSLTGETGKEFYRRCKAVNGIEETATAIHGITDSDVKDQEPYQVLISESYYDLIKFINNRTLVGHNIKMFDLPILGIETDNVFDTMLVSRKLWHGGHKNVECAAYFGLEWDESKAHGARYDTLMSVKIFMELQAPAAKAEIARREADRIAKNRSLMTDENTPQIVLDILNGAQTFLFNTKGPVKDITSSAPFESFVKESSYVISINETYCPKNWATPLSVPGMIEYTGKDPTKKGKQYISSNLEKNAVKIAARYIAPDGAVYTKSQLVKAGWLRTQPQSGYPITVGLDTIQSYKVLG